VTLRDVSLQEPEIESPWWVRLATRSKL
jgi:hypothetical protein